MYMLEKPTKYCLKLVCITDAWSSYLCDARSDGAIVTKKKYQQPIQPLIWLTKNFKWMHMNLTCDKWLTSTEAAE